MPLHRTSVEKPPANSSVVSNPMLKRRERRAPAAKLAVGYLLDELKNDITREPPA